MKLLRSMLKDSFTLKKMTDSISSGKLTRTLASVSTGNPGRFEPIRGSQIAGLIGDVKQATMRLFADYDSEIQVGRVIEDEGTNEEYDVVRVFSLGGTTNNEYMEAELMERRRDIA